ncbi:protein phosphatase 2C domain-containing protein [Galbitalea sp. SE-J8]|uniref:PP2C family protein-serine/threonine phosphatase n=1 Tax=Galbitalea sp. SE-J8 TaxID=3054952 RepID=UPI00259CC757|nr:protein phosphatase 2C domain-containing protein [Galbitalea sp. SE-J8]MDM4761534.1 protein phosphatase 2C domain-containing protein [Galbitalea sp. SE-J8]
MSGAPIRVEVGVATDVGTVRRVNEDSAIAEFPVFAVADGMGGHDTGDLASAAVVEALRALVGRERPQPEDVTAALRRAHAVVHELATRSERGAGSTVAGVVLVAQDERPHWLVFNIGDSRVYRLRGERFEQLTRDHSIAQELVDDGLLAREDVPHFRGRNVITRAVGAEDSEADRWLIPVGAEERLLICSDGLTGEIGDDVVAAMLARRMPAQHMADALVAAALAAGGRDNVTVVVVDVLEGGAAAELDDETGVVERMPPAHDTTESPA